MAMEDRMTHSLTCVCVSSLEKEVVRGVEELVGAFKFYIYEGGAFDYVTPEPSSLPEGSAFHLFRGSHFQLVPMRVCGWLVSACMDVSVVNEGAHCVVCVHVIHGMSFRCTSVIRFTLGAFNEYKAAVWIHRALQKVLRIL